jgi:hypothetical protein
MGFTLFLSGGWSYSWAGADRKAARFGSCRDPTWSPRPSAVCFGHVRRGVESGVEQVVSLDWDPLAPS